MSLAKFAIIALHLPGRLGDKSLMFAVVFAGKIGANNNLALYDLIPLPRGCPRLYRFRYLNRNVHLLNILFEKLFLHASKSIEMIEGDAIHVVPDRILRDEFVIVLQKGFYRVELFKRTDRKHIGYRIMILCQDCVDGIYACDIMTDSPI